MTKKFFAQLNLFVPDLDFIRKTLHTLDERCPQCKKHRNASDMVYIGMYTESPSAACWYCLPQHRKENRINESISSLITQSDFYVRELVTATNPFKWQVKVRGKQDDEHIRNQMREAISLAIQHNWYACKCQGKYSSEATLDPEIYLERYEACAPFKKRTFPFTFSSIGVFCTKCLNSNPANLADFQGKKDLKIKQRCICEGMRYAAWLARWQDKLMVTNYDLDHEGPDPWRIKWADWRPEEWTDTRYTDCFNCKLGPHVQVNKRVYVF